MTNFVPYLNGAMTLSENMFNTLGYLPKERFPEVNAFSTSWRFRLGFVQIIGGIAVFAIGLYVDSLNKKTDPKKYLTLAQQMISLGISYANHGSFNIIRAFAERQGLGVLLGAYDFYGRKLLPPLSTHFDLQGQLFGQIRRLLNRVHFITLFPFELSLRN